MIPFPYTIRNQPRPENKKTGGRQHLDKPRRCGIYYIIKTCALKKPFGLLSVISGEKTLIFTAVVINYCVMGTRAPAIGGPAALEPEIGQ